ncbi:MAG: hypothetical protein HFH41_13780 [Lachnospiraceae bacterium]|nr:hypothetical protein [Lachnospiraceae bacterium]
MPVSFYEIVWIFLIYAFLGWCTEVAYAALELKEFVNRGFLNGPVCPIYGCGVLVVITLLMPLKDSFLLLFAGSFFLTSVLEFITGFLLEKIFHNQWWDYSEENFNICGYVCLKFSILWGLGCTLIIDMIHPNIYRFIKIIPKVPGTVLLVLCSVTFVIDLVITVSTILKFNQRLKLIDEAASRIKVVSNEIGENIYEGMTIAMEKREEWKENIENRTAEFTENHEELAENISSVLDNVKSAVAERRESLTEKKDILAEKRAEKKDILAEKRMEKNRLQKEYDTLMEHESFGMKRLMQAFPSMKSKTYQEALTKWKAYRNEKKSSAK